MKMKNLFRRLSRVADSSHYEALPSGKEERKAIRKGHLPVFVGKEMERFVVPAELLGRPVFVELLRLSAEEYGYEQRGALRIPCSVPVFRQVLYYLLAESDGRQGFHVVKEEMLRLFEES